MKSFLPYFVKFEKDDKILPKKYSSDYAVEELDWKLIIMITDDNNTFSVNNSWQ